MKAWNLARRCIHFLEECCREFLEAFHSVRSGDTTNSLAALSRARPTKLFVNKYGVSRRHIVSTKLPLLAKNGKKVDYDALGTSSDR